MLIQLRQELERRGLLAEVWKFDLLARARRPWRVDMYPTRLEESRERPGQLRLAREFEEDLAAGRGG